MRRILLLFALSGLVTIRGQEGSGGDTASVTLDIVTSFGEPVKDMMVHIDRVDGADSEAVHKIVHFQGPMPLSLPYGIYRFGCEPSGDSWASERTLDLFGPRAFVLLAVAQAESYLTFGEGGVPQYTVEGTVMHKGKRKGTLLVRLRGVYLSTTADSQVEASGHFRLAVRFQGDYDLELIETGSLLVPGSVLARRPVRFDQSTGDHVRMDLAVPLAAGSRGILQSGRT